jgi:hypothetical protein
MSGHHTSWRLNAGDETSVMDSRNRKILRAECGGASGIKLAEAEANARLIAAAPDLLAALVNCMDILGRAESNASGMGAEWDYVGPRVAAARAAIAKATGQ